MISEARVMPHAVQSATLADVLERVLDKGVVIAGDIKIKAACEDTPSVGPTRSKETGPMTLASTAAV